MLAANLDVAVGEWHRINLPTRPEPYEERVLVDTACFADKVERIDQHWDHIRATNDIASRFWLDFEFDVHGRASLRNDGVLHLWAQAIFTTEQWEAEVNRDWSAHPAEYVAYSSLFPLWFAWLITAPERAGFLDRETGCAAVQFAMAGIDWQPAVTMARVEMAAATKEE